MQRLPQDETRSLATQTSPQRCAPGLHVTVHAPDTHATVPSAGVGQGEQRCPQVASWSSRAQLGPQRWVPTGQLKSQVCVPLVAMHVGVAPCGAVQGVHSTPQVAVAESGEQMSPQRCVPVGHGARQRPSSQREGAVHCWPQVPQFIGSLRGSTQPTEAQ